MRNNHFIPLYILMVLTLSALFFTVFPAQAATKISDQRNTGLVERGIEHAGFAPSALITVPVLSIETLEGDEAFGPFAFYITLSESTSVTITGKVATANITATAPADYSALVNQAFTITAGATETFVYVDVIDDGFREVTETFKVSVTQISNATVNPVENGGWAYGYIADDDETPALSVSDSSANESAGVATLHVSLSAPHTVDVTATIQPTEDSANAGVDFDSSAIPFTIPAGQMTTTVAITLVNDTLDEASEQFVALISDPSVLREDDEARITILDNDAPPNLVVQAAADSELSTVLVFTVTLDAPSGLDVTGLAATSNGSAKSGSDYVSLAAKIFTIPSGLTNTTIYVAVSNETLFERDETLTLIVSSVANAVVSLNSNVGTILNDDLPPAINIANTAASESSALQFTVSLDEVSAVDASGRLTTSNASALAGIDYIAASNKPFTVTAGNISTTVSVTLINDSLDESDESLTATMGSLVDASVGDLAAAGLIVDEDPEPQLTVGDATANESAGVMTFTVSLNTLSSFTVSGVMSSLDLNATELQDYTPQSNRPFTIPAGTTSTQVTIVLLNDSLDEDDEAFFFSAANVENATVIHGDGIGTISDNDAPPTLSFANGSFSESHSGVITLTLNTASGRAISGALLTSNGSATATVDYGPLSQAPFTIEAGDTQTVVEFYIVNDLADEESENFTVTLDSLDNATAGNSTTIITLLDDDASPTISLIASSASEAQGKIDLPIRINQASGKLITGMLSSNAGTATSPADYTSLISSPFTITIGLTQTLVSVPIVNDTLDEIDELFSAQLNSVNNATLGTVTASATILDNDAPPALTIVDVVGAESNGTFSFTIALNAVSSLPVTGKATTANDSAIAASDYTALSNKSFTIAAGSTSTVIGVAINNDLNDEFDEQFFVNLSSVGNAQASDSTASGTIQDNDQPPTLSIANATALENAGNLAFTFTLSLASGKPINLQLNSVAGTAISPNDYTQQNNSMFTIAPGTTSGTIPVPIISDPNDELDETFTLNVALSDPTTASLTTSSLSATILDDDAPPTLTVADASALESAGQLVFTLKLSAASSFAISGTVNTSNGSAVAGSDYTALTGQTFSFPIGSAQTTVAIALSNDLLLENSETFTLTVATLTSATKQDPIASGTLQDDDSSGTGRLTIVVDVAPKSIQNFKFIPSFASEFYLDDELDGAQSDSYTSAKSFTLAAGLYTVTPVTPYSYYLMDIVCTSNGVTFKTGTTPQLPVLGSGQSAVCTFFNQRGVTVRAQAYNDLSKNKLYDQADAKLAGVTTELLITPSTNSQLSETTDSSGRIDWSYRKPGPYTICAVDWPLAAPLMVQPTLIDATYAWPCYRFNLNPGAIAAVYFGFRVDDGTVVAAVEGINEFDPLLTSGSAEEGVFFSQTPDVVDDMQGYEASGTEDGQTQRVYIPLVTR